MTHESQEPTAYSRSLAGLLAEWDACRSLEGEHCRVVRIVSERSYENPDRLERVWVAGTLSARIHALLGHARFLLEHKVAAHMALLGFDMSRALEDLGPVPKQERYSRVTR